MQIKKPTRPLHNIMLKHAKPERIQKRQSDLILTFAGNDHQAIAKLIQQWLNESVSSA